MGERFALDALVAAGLLFAARYSGGSSSAGVVLAGNRIPSRQSHLSPLSIRRLWHETNCAFSTRIVDGELRLGLLLL
jgi:hypothetical protein